MFLLYVIFVNLYLLYLGTKCLSGLERTNAKLPGALLNDSHAEVLARRGLIYWLQVIHL